MLQNTVEISSQKINVICLSESYEGSIAIQYFLLFNTLDSQNAINKRINSNTLFLKSLHIHLSLLKYEGWQHKLNHLKSLKNVHLSYSESVSGSFLYKYISPLYKNR